MIRIRYLMVSNAVFLECVSIWESRGYIQHTITGTLCCIGQSVVVLDASLPSVLLDYWISYSEATAVCLILQLTLIGYLEIAVVAASLGIHF